MKMKAVLGLLTITLLATNVYATESIKLPDPNLDSGKTLMQSLKDRQSERDFSDKELPLDVLSNLLWAAYGVNRPGIGLRTAPSATNAQQIDIYVAFKKGMYLYDHREHQLNFVFDKDIREYCGKQSFTQEAPVNLIFVCDYTRLNFDEESNKFYAATDTGYISQNVYLYCASEGLATVVLGWIDKPILAKEMKLKETQEVILTQPVGYRKTNNE